MYNPPGNDNTKEFVEIYADYTLPNLTGFVIGDLSSNDTLTLVGDFKPSKYALIVEENASINNPSVSMYSAGKTIGNGLGNSGDTIFLWNTTSLITELSFNPILGGNGNGRSLELHNNILKDSGKVGGSPGDENSENYEDAPTDLSIQWNEMDLFTFYEYNNLFTIYNNLPEHGSVSNISIQSEFSSNKSIVHKKSLTLYSSSQTSNVFFTHPGFYRICGTILSSIPYDINLSNNKICRDVEVKDSTLQSCTLDFSLTLEDKLWFDNSSVPLNFTLSNESFPFQLDYWVEDLFGVVVKTKLTTNNVNKKSFNPHLTEFDQAFKIFGNLSFIACNYTGPRLLSSMFIVRATEDRNETSSLSITNLYTGNDKSVPFGAPFRVRVDVYKGNTDKKTVKSWVENKEGIRITSHITQFNVDKKYSQSTHTIPIMLKPNCNHNLENGDYILKISGLDKTIEEELEVSGITSSSCEKTTDVQSIRTHNLFSSAITSLPTIVSPKDPFEVEVELSNDRDTSTDVKIWSYVYRGSKSYSGDREKNMQILRLGEYETKRVRLKTDLLEDIEEGEYKLKVLVNKDNQKSSNDITNDIKVITTPLTSTPNHAIPTSISPPDILFQSSSYKQLDLVPYLLSAVCILFSVYVTLAFLFSR